MRIINAMFGCGKGGIEQASIDYAKALTAAGHEVLSLLHPKSWAAEAMPETFATNTIPNLGEWDRRASFRLNRIIKAFAPDIMIAHGNRAISLLARGRKRHIPLVGVAHNYQLDRFHKPEAVFAITKHLADTLKSQGIPESSIYRIPNMMRIEAACARPAFGKPPVIGSMGRFVAKKGFDIFLHALAELKTQGHAFSALLGGGGEDEKELKKLAYSLNVPVTFTGWVEDKKAFLNQLDIFCLPSHHEPFGIVLLEAFEASLPVASTRSEGPGEIITHGKDGLLSPTHDAKALAANLAVLLQDEKTAFELGKNARHTLEAHYTMPIVAARMTAALEDICSRYHANKSTAKRTA